MSYGEAAQPSPAPSPGADRLRVTALGVLVLAYLGVSVIAYTDYPNAQEHTPLADRERRGLAVWRKYNCQACHQIHGFGGFLGPDLTNRVDDNTPDDAFDYLLQKGVGRMPALHLDPEEREAVIAYLRALNRTGKATPRPLAGKKAVNPWEHFRLIGEEWSREKGRELPPAARRGLDLVTKMQCGACHVPFMTGRHLSPDLSLWAINRKPAALSEIFSKGKGRMPVFRFQPAEVQDVAAWMEWMRRERADLVDVNQRLIQSHDFSWTSVPWFEYEQ